MWNASGIRRREPPTSGDDSNLVAAGPLLMNDAEAAEVAEVAEDTAFDFESHRQGAVAEYLTQRDFFVDLAHAVQRIVQECLKRKGVKVNSVDSRAKDAVSFAEKAVSPADDDPDVPKYNDPLRQITDLAGVRIITFFPNTLNDIHKIIDDEFEIVEHSDKGAALIEEERFGYQSIHYLVKLRKERAALPEYERFADAIVEIQVRTILQHAWAEIEHDIQYKSASVIPAAIRRRFMALAGLLELADREFQAIQDADTEITKRAQESVERGDLDVEITPGALKTYLDGILGVDGRMSRSSYEWAARLLKSLGFKTLDQVDDCIDGYNDDQVSRIHQSYRLGQTSRFEYMLLAGMGEKYIERHPWVTEPWFVPQLRLALERFGEHGIRVGDFDPLTAALDE